MPNFASCSGCQNLPKLLFARSDVFVQLPTNRHRSAFERALGQGDFEFEPVDGGHLVRGVDFEGFVDYLGASVFNSVEKREVTLLPLSEGGALTFSALQHHKTLHEWISLSEGREVVSIIDDARIKTLFQPIVEAATRKIYGYEALSRGVLPDGSLMNPGTLFGQAKAMDLLFYLDRVCREASIRAAAKAGITEKLFINFVPTAIYEPSLCLQTTARVLAEEGLDSSQVVFEVVETERVEDFDHLNQILDYYRSRGYSTALDDIGSGYSDIPSLLRLRPNYMKIDMNIIRDIHLDPQKQAVLDAFISQGKQIGLKVLAEGIETAEEYTYIAGKDIDLMQGYLFGAPQAEPVREVSLP